MRSLFRILVTLIWALWFGGIIGLFLSVTTLFKFDRSIAIQAAPQIFFAFEKYQLVLASFALLATFFWRLRQPLGRVGAIFVLFALASVGSVVETTLVTPRIEALRVEGATHTPAFGRLHGLSMLIYVGEASILLAGGIVIALSPAGAPLVDRTLIRASERTV